MTHSDIIITSQKEQNELSIYQPSHSLEWNEAQSSFEKW